ncbi:hypothetical protein MLD38_004598 [Melastoma candidum]|uniref:Uncharacterized protein n=1 Tax=Melastoma candidum TaxID=119954 RepID=A0ACB9S7I9_9MYRT|nr:hypothetical protein MLD38_004598 [Melastoma candidum]
MNRHFMLIICSRCSQLRALIFTIHSRGRRTPNTLKSDQVRDNKKIRQFIPHYYNKAASKRNWTKFHNPKQKIDNDKENIHKLSNMAVVLFSPSSSLLPKFQPRLSDPSSPPSSPRQPSLEPRSAHTPMEVRSEFTSFPHVLAPIRSLMSNLVSAVE